MNPNDFCAAFIWKNGKMSSFSSNKSKQVLNINLKTVFAEAQWYDKPRTLTLFISIWYHVMK